MYRMTYNWIQIRCCLPSYAGTLASGTPTATPAFNDGDLIEYAVHTLIEVNCVEPPAPPVGGVALEVDLDALPLDSPSSSTGNWLSPAALATMAFAVIVLGGVAWFARNRSNASARR